MSQKTKIEWTDFSWNPIKARVRLDTLIQLNGGKSKVIPSGKVGYHCERISPGCVNCYACNMNGRTLPAWGTGFEYTVPNRDKVEIFLDEAELLKPLKWKAPRKIFVCSMTDMFAEFVTDEMLDRMFAAMALCPQHTFQCLTKRADRMLKYFSPGFCCDARIATRGKIISTSVTPFRLPSELVFDAKRVAHNDSWEMVQWPLLNLHLGVSVENQKYADERIPLLLKCPAAVRWVSYEPALGPVDFTNIRVPLDGDSFRTFSALDETDGLNRGKARPGIDWVVFGGESGPGARPLDVAWARQTIEQCKSASVACFVKQLGSSPCYSGAINGLGFDSEVLERRTGDDRFFVRLSDRKGGEMSEWPEDLRIRELPQVPA